ncbi:MAG: hypothetical protein HYV27_11985 [Candidatus Hydrogenedentes bacterium]|nr:hypothetical protein [Candidatus Hydrogenedentota bacterium]
MRLFFVVVFTLATPLVAQHNGFIQRGDETRFPIGFYEVPGDAAGLQRMAAAGVNLVRCGSVKDLDRAHAAGIQGWVSLPFQSGATEQMRADILQYRDHPALVVWEGPDEIVWNFTAYSGLFRDAKVHPYKGAWADQDPAAVAYAKEQAAIILPKINAATALIRELDTRQLPIWINEANDSDAIYVRQYYPNVDITGCDLYPVKAGDRDLARMADSTERWNRVGEGRPVWMVLQAFSWSELGMDPPRPLAYPSFEESRFMAYDVIAHGAEGILYWGSQFLQSGACRAALYAVTGELAALQGFLTAPAMPGISVNLVEAPVLAPQRGVHSIARVHGGEALIVLINEDRGAHMAVEVNGLDAIEGRELHLLYGDESLVVTQGRIMTRMPRQMVKVFATSTTFESPDRSGRDYPGEPESDRPAAKE